MTSTTTKPAAVQPDGEMRLRPLFDDWFDPIEAGLRDRVRDFIETMIESELDAALARPRYARRPADAQERDGGAGRDRRPPAWPPDAHADGHLRHDRDHRAAGPDRDRGRQDDRVEEQGAAGLPAAHAEPPMR